MDANIREYSLFLQKIRVICGLFFPVRKVSYLRTLVPVPEEYLQYPRNGPQPGG
jgi:hypothetical protein